MNSRTETSLLFYCFKLPASHHLINIRADCCAQTMPSVDKPRSTRTSRPIASTKHDLWLHDAEKHIAETLRRQGKRQEKKDWILFPGETVDPSTASRKKVMDVVSNHRLLSPVPSPKVCHRAARQIEATSKHASLSGKETEESFEMRDSIPHLEKSIIRRSTPPPAPSPPRLPTPELEDLNGDERWSCC